MPRDGHEERVDAGVGGAVGAHPAVAPGLGRHPFEGVPAVVDLGDERMEIAVRGPPAATQTGTGNAEGRFALFAKVCALRREIARMLTIQREREGGTDGR